MILVTGGAGFIGSNLVAALMERGAGPVAVCDSFGSDDKWKNLAKHAVADFVHPDGLAEWLSIWGDKLECVFHMGASSSTTERNVDYIMKNNFALTHDLWHWCAEEGVRFIYASSAATYGGGEHGFIDDNDASALAKLKPLNPYGWSKHIFDINAVRMAGEGVTPPQWAGLKFFNVYGPNEYHKGGQQSVPVQLFEQIRDTGRARLFRSHRPDYADGGQMRDFIWVGDCVSVMLWLYDNPEVKGIFNCGTGKARSFADLARATFAAMGANEDIHFIDTPEAIRNQYQYFTEADMKRLRAAGYDRPFTELEDGIRAYVRDFLAADDIYR